VRMRRKSMCSVAGSAKACGCRLFVLGNQHRGLGHNLADGLGRALFCLPLCEMCASHGHGVFLCVDYSSIYGHKVW